jgi:hypothetical protein
MKRMVALAAVMLVLCPAAGLAQDVTVPKNIERLAERAVEAVNVTVDGALLQLAARFLSADDPDQKIVKGLISGLKGVYVRSFEFANAGEYSDADLDSLRAQVKAPNWQRMVGVRSMKGGENVDVFFRMENDKIAGVVVIAAQARQLTFVNIVGEIDLAQLAKLGGNLGIPKINIEKF